MMRLQIVTDWLFVDGRNVSRAVNDYEGMWYDVTGQPDANIVPAPNTVIFEGIVSDDVFADIQADHDANLPESPVILWSEVYNDGA